VVPLKHEAWRPAGEPQLELATRTYVIYPAAETDDQTIEEFGLEADPFVYVVPVCRSAGDRARGAASLCGQGEGGLATFAVDAAWFPAQCPAQTDKGMATFLSALYTMVHKLQHQSPEATRRILVSRHASRTP
jgi:hypothetical protein